ncbi:D-alanine--D-alanine ligase [Candidatus Ishikawella capsulata]|uniref:D-alanine--D-alanine ligase n=1 Tax=Candidatus Ishikawaella capsulata Mpkobe TaxID=476281 RepID=C5WD40_9ENTR|nr:D-alanine--D-alanine ligase [Candidatus Ishikawaella capsulata]BAH83246.1 D-alanylalanine synthetase [Candidatus Ishikawaella capsulata Mpkobe]
MAEKIAVLMGGTSNERNISLMSGKTVLQSMREIGINAYPIDTKNYPVIDLKKDGFDKAFIALHGGKGEDGHLQAILDFINIKHTGNSVITSAITMDKIRTKLLWQGSKLPTSNFIKINRENIKKCLDPDIQEAITALNLPLFVKPNCSGSSIGISKINNLKKLYSAVKKASYHDEEVLIETFLSGPEYTVGIIGEKILPSVRIQANKEFYNYEAKYITNDTQYFCPSGLTNNREQELQSLAYSAWKILGGNKWGRVDVMMDEEDKFHLLEVNTSPGMTYQSLIPRAAKQLGWSFSDLIMYILQLADNIV